MTEAQLFSYHDAWLSTDIMTDRVYFLSKNYRVACEKFKGILERVRKGRATSNDANKIMKLHHVFYKSDSTFKDEIENHEKTMWLFSNNADVRKKNVDKLVSTSKTKGVPVARLDCRYNTNKLQNGKERHARRSQRHTYGTPICAWEQELH